MNRYQALIDQNEYMAEMSAKLATDFLKSQNIERACNNFEAVATHMNDSGLVEWKLGTKNPSCYFQRAFKAVLSAADLVSQLHPQARVACFENYLEVAYSLLIMRHAIPSKLRDVITLPESERAHPDELRTRIVQLMDSHFFELAETGEIPAGWESFEEWLSKKRGFKLYRETFAAYVEVLAAARNRDTFAAQLAIAKSEKLYTKRATGPDIGGHWGALEKYNDDIVDIRLACIIRKAEEIGGPDFGPLESIHRWHWN